MRSKYAKRDAAIVRALQSGASQPEVAKKYDITPSRVSQILQTFNQRNAVGVAETGNPPEDVRPVVRHYRRRKPVVSLERKPVGRGTSSLEVQEAQQEDQPPDTFESLTEAHNGRPTIAELPRLINLAGNDLARLGHTLKSLKESIKTLEEAKKLCTERLLEAIEQ